MKIIKHGNSHPTKKGLGIAYGYNECRKCGCGFELTANDRVHAGGGDWFVYCPECGEGVIVSDD